MSSKYVTNRSMDKLLSMLIYYDSETDLVINSISIRLTGPSENRFTGKIKDFNVLNIESGKIKFADMFEILSIIPENNKITIYIYEHK